jgi:hypothetical protein
LLRLVGRLQERIAAIDRTVGLDASVLGEIIHSRYLAELKRIKAGEREIMDELERQSELISTDEMKLPLITYLQAIGEERLREIPLGIHSGKRAALDGVFLAFKARDRHFWRLYPVGGSQPITDKKRIFQMIFCGRKEERLVPPHDIFPLLEQATREITQELKSQQTVNKIRPRQRRMRINQVRVRPFALRRQLPCPTIRPRVPQWGHCSSRGHCLCPSFSV